MLDTVEIKHIDVIFFTRGDSDRSAEGLWEGRLWEGRVFLCHKAFDRVEHSFLRKVTGRFGFSSGFIAMSLVLHGDIESLLK